MVVAFLDIRPLTTGHLLVVPRTHVPGLASLPEPTGAHMPGRTKSVRTTPTAVLPEVADALSEAKHQQ